MRAPLRPLRLYDRAGGGVRSIGALFVVSAVEDPPVADAGGTRVGAPRNDAMLPGGVFDAYHEALARELERFKHPGAAVQWQPVPSSAPEREFVAQLGHALRARALAVGRASRTRRANDVLRQVHLAAAVSRRAPLAARAGLR